MRTRPEVPWSGRGMWGAETSSSPVGQRGYYKHTANVRLPSSSDSGILGSVVTVGPWDTSDETEWAIGTSRLNRFGIWGARLREFGRQSTTGGNFWPGSYRTGDRMVSESREFLFLSAGDERTMRSFGRGLSRGSEEVDEKEVNEERDELES